MFFVYLDNSALSGVSFVNIFSQSVACFVGLNCHFIFMLFMEGNSVSAVE